MSIVIKRGKVTVRLPLQISEGETQFGAREDFKANKSTGRLVRMSLMKQKRNSWHSEAVCLLLRSISRTTLYRVNMYAFISWQSLLRIGSLFNRNSNSILIPDEPPIFLEYMHNWVRPNTTKNSRKFGKCESCYGTADVALCIRSKKCTIPLLHTILAQLNSWHKCTGVAISRGVASGCRVLSLFQPSSSIGCLYRDSPKGPFTNDVRREGEGGGYPNSDAVREVAWF